MNYNVDVLKNMIVTLTRNIEARTDELVNLTRTNPEYLAKTSLEKRLAELVAERRGLAALVENDGMPLAGVTVDTMLYSATGGADTSKWG